MMVMRAGVGRGGGDGGGGSSVSLRTTRFRLIYTSKFNYAGVIVRYFSRRLIITFNPGCVAGSRNSPGPSIFRN